MSSYERRTRIDGATQSAAATPAAALWPLLRALRSHRLVAIAIVALTVLSQPGLDDSARSPVLRNCGGPGHAAFGDRPVLCRVAPPEGSRPGCVVRRGQRGGVAGLARGSRARGKAGRGGPRQASVEAAVEVERSEDAGLVTVTASSDDAELSAAIANEFVKAALDTRASELGEIAAQQIERSQELIDEAGSSSVLAERKPAGPHRGPRADPRLRRPDSDGGSPGDGPDLA